MSPTSGVPSLLPPEQFVVYCDESRHDPHKSNAFMGIGGLWVPQSKRDSIKFEVDRVAREHGLGGELKWSKVSATHLKGYKAVVDVFALHPELQFRIILVEQAKLDLSRYHGGDRELGFYKFYYEMLVKWLQPNLEYVILLDHRMNTVPRRCAELHRVLTRKLSFTKIRQLAVIDSKASRLAQLSDLLTGAVTAVWCGDATAGSPKGELRRHIEDRAGGRSLRLASPSPAPSKVNIFQIQLQEPAPRAASR